uniref:Uncharacterized protein n=1 Tax=Aegilops tauschii subsp. strangulata TaxID=200361 RepID=A0A452Y053_AEGTS
NHFLFVSLSSSPPNYHDAPRTVSQSHPARDPQIS